MSPLVENFPYIGLFVLLLLGGMGVPFFPEDATLILCGLLIQAGVIEPVQSLCVVYAGILIADYAIYAFGRKYGRMAITHRWFHRFLPPSRLPEFEDKFNRHGILIIMFGRNLMGVRVQIILASGIMRMPKMKFLLTDAFTSLFTISAWVAVGYVGGHSLQDIGGHTRNLIFIASMIVVLFFGGFFVFNYIKKRNINSSQSLGIRHLSQTPPEPEPPEERRYI